MNMLTLGILPATKIHTGYKQAPCFLSIKGKQCW